MKYFISFNCVYYNFYCNYIVFLFQSILNENTSPITSRPGTSNEVLSKSLRSPILGQQASSPNDSISRRNNFRPLAMKPIPIQGSNVSYFYLIIEITKF